MAAATAASRRATSPSGVREANPRGNSSAMKPVESLPSRHRGWFISADRNGILCRMPSI
jgi:hypothetical protein